MKSRWTTTREWPLLATTRKSLSTAHSNEDPAQGKKKHTAKSPEARRFRQLSVGAGGKTLALLTLATQETHAHHSPREEFLPWPLGSSWNLCCGQRRQSPGVTASRNSRCQQSHRLGCRHSSGICCNGSLDFHSFWGIFLDKMGSCFSFLSPVV